MAIGDDTGSGEQVPPSSPAGDFPVVAIGASAGGLDALRRFFEAAPPESGMAFIVVQHLDPTHPSMLVELLAKYTAMTVQHAVDGMPIERDCVYVIPPGAYLSVRDGAVRLSEPHERHGARLPFDFLLHSLAEEFGDRAICVVLSGTGADGSLGLKSVNEASGFVVAQDPDEAEHDGMPRSAIATNAVNRVLPVAEIPEAISSYVGRMARLRTERDGADEPDAVSGDGLTEIVELVRTKTAHDFTQYKPGTLLRRIERRMAMSEIEADHMERYLDVLRQDTGEINLLVEDLLINVTGFFRDSSVFEFLAEKIIPDLLADCGPDRPLRIWVAGCSTGEEAYSYAILVHEQIAAAGHNVKLQIFASDIDAGAVAKAREGVYPVSIESEVSPERLARYFTKEGRTYRISSDLRSTVVFAVQDVLSDPPFSRLDLISCRNLLIYLNSEAQAKVLTVIHFALRENGILVLGSAETAGNDNERFAVVSKSGRVYRHIGHSRPGELGLPVHAHSGVRTLGPASENRALSRETALAELCQRLVTQAHAPASVLINRENECLYSLGPTDRYLRLAPGHATRDVFAMAREGVRVNLRSAVQRARRENAPIGVPGGQTVHEGTTLSFAIEAQPVRYDGEDLLLLCFIEEQRGGQEPSAQPAPGEASQVAELERELETTKQELEDAISELEQLTESQKAINENALTANEEFQATNEELLTSKEELQSLNEELTALNSQLQEALEQQRTSANDLENILKSTDIATIFLDRNLNIRFFTPATTSFFRVIPGDVGRPLADINSLAADSTLLDDADTVLRVHDPIEQEIELPNGTSFVRRIMPYRVDDNEVEGVVITFAEITAQKRASEALANAERLAQTANAAKSRFLAAASHDLRQPLQTIFLLRGLLARAVEGEKAQSLVFRLHDAAMSMSGMLNALLDINQIEAGTIRAEPVGFPVSELLQRLGDEFTYHAKAKGLDLRVVPCGLSVHSDPRLLEQMLRNLLSNALKYTDRGKVLLGCRRHEGTLSIVVSDTGAGIPDGAYETIFGDYEQLDNVTRDRDRGFGLGLSIVQRLSELLGHPVRVRSTQGRGSAFAIEVALSGEGVAEPTGPARIDNDAVVEGENRQITFLIVEDEPDVRDLLKLFLEGEGHRVAAAPDGEAALELVTRDELRPDFVLVDYNLPNAMDGLEVAAELRARLRHEVPTIVLTGDISTETLSSIALHGYVQMNKPVKTDHLMQVVGRLLSITPSPQEPARRSGVPETAGSADDGPIVYVVDDDNRVAEELRNVLEIDGRCVAVYSTAEDFLEAYNPDREACLLIDAYLPGMSGVELLKRITDADQRLTAIMITGKGDISMAVDAMKAGASDLFEKPVDTDLLLSGVENALERARDASKQIEWREEAERRLGTLTPRQREVMDLILAGRPNKIIAADLGISQRTVETHRAEILKRTGAKSLPELVRLVLAASSMREGDGPPLGD